MDGEFHTTSILIQVVSIVDYLSVAYPYTSYCRKLVTA